MEAQASAQKITARRERNRTMTIRATQDEKDFIMRKMELSGAGKFNLYALKMLVFGEIKNIDLTHYQTLAKEVSRIGASINQIAKFVNTGGRIFEPEMADLQQKMEDIWRLLKSSLSELR